MGKAKVNIPMCAALVLLLLTLVSIHLTSGLYARYTTTSTAGDSARVAKFEVQGAQSGELVIQSDLDSKGDYCFQVKNNSEVAVSYTVDFCFDFKVKHWLIAGVDLNGDGDLEDEGEKGTFDSDGKICTIPIQGLLAPGGTANHSVKIVVDKWARATKEMRNDEPNWTMGFSVEIHAVQVD